MVIINSILGSLLSVSVLVMATMGITLIYKTSYTTNFAQGSIAVIGGYVATMLCATQGFSVWAALPVAIAASIAFAALVDIVLFRMGRSVNPVGKQIITMGLVLLIVGAIPLVFGAAGYIQEMSFIGSAHKIEFTLFGGEVVIMWNSLFCFGVAAAAIAAIFLMLKYSKWGISVRATASNEYVAQMMGINTKVVTAATWGIAGGLGALSAIMLLGSAPLSVGYMTSVQVDAFMASILGGFDTFAGPVLGAVLIPVVRYLLQYFVSLWADVITYVLILAVVLWKPTGLLGKKEVKKV